LAKISWSKTDQREPGWGGLCRETSRIRLSASIPLIPLEIPLQVPLQFRCSIPQGRGRKPLKTVVFCRWNQFGGRFLREFSAACRGIRAGFGYDPEPADPLTEVSDE
jgi:hypothetical protein